MRYDRGTEGRSQLGEQSWLLLPDWTMLAAALLIAFLTASIIVFLQQRADEWRQSEVLLARLDSLTRHLNALEWKVVEEKRLSPMDAVEVQAIQNNASDLIARLQRIDSNPEDLRRLDRMLRAYFVILRKQFDFLLAEQPQAARDGVRMEAQKIYLGLSKAIADADADFSRDAAWTKHKANLGTTAALLLAAGSIGMLFRRFERVRRQSAALVAEQKALQQSEERFRSLIRNASDVILVLDREGIARYVSPAIHRLLGHPVDEVRDRSALELIHPDDRIRAGSVLEQVCLNGGEVNSEWRLRHADGGWRCYEANLHNLLTEPGVEGILITCRDITERKEFEEQLAHQAFHDTLSELPNRALFMDRLGHALSRARRSKKDVAVLCIDLDNFKVINDSLGHEAGDELLVAVSRRLKGCVRQSDTVARLGGDEFSVLLEEISAQTDVLRVAERIVESLLKPIRMRERDVFTSASIGIALSADSCMEAEGLLRDADTAMYQAKTSGKAGYVLFERSMNSKAVERLEIETGLRTALEQGHLRLHYQPVIKLETGRIHEVEALLRWKHPQRGLISPAKFIPIAEETGLILSIGEWVLYTACRQAVEWQSQYALKPSLVMGVNISARQLQHPAFIDRVAEILRETGLKPGCLKLEITESVMMQDVGATAERLQRLKDLGVHLAIDDFGTGYSSMAYLNTLPIDTLKIDRSFVRRIGFSEDAEAIVRAIITLAKSLNLRVTSEGIETVEQLNYLRTLGCDLGQGYYFAKPLTLPAMDYLFAERMGIRRKVARVRQAVGQAA